MLIEEQLELELEYASLDPSWHRSRSTRTYVDAGLMEMTSCVEAEEQSREGLPPDCPRQGRNTEPTPGPATLANK